MSKVYHVEIWLEGEGLGWRMVDIGTPDRDYQRCTPSTVVLNTDTRIYVYWPEYGTRDGELPAEHLSDDFIRRVHDSAMEWFEQHGDTLQ